MLQLYIKRQEKANFRKMTGYSSKKTMLAEKGSVAYELEQVRKIIKSFGWNSKDAKAFEVKIGEFTKKGLK